MLLEAALIFGVTLLAGAVPLVFRGSDRILHLCIAFATGIFLGVLFLDLLPEVAEMAGATHAHAEAESVAPAGAEPGGSDHGGGAPPGLLVWGCVLLGVVGLFLIESLILNGGGHGDEHRHLTVGWATFVGLSIHALTSGLGMAAGALNPELVTPFLVSILSHKVAESFSLTTVFMLAGFSFRKTWLLLVAFAFVTPVGVELGSLLARRVPGVALEVLTGLAAGTFLFVALGDLLPEVFHRRIDAGRKVLLLGLGAAVTVLVHLLPAR